MAQFGAKCPMFAPFKTEPAAALPTYDTAVTVGALVSANLTVNLASGELYADDALKEQLSEFASGTVALETDDMTDAVAQVIYGATGDSSKTGELKFNKGDARRPEGVQGLFLSQGTRSTRQRQCGNPWQQHYLWHYADHADRVRVQYRRLAYYQGVYR